LSEVLSIRIPRELKRRIKELGDLVNWKEEIIKYLEERVVYYEKLKFLRKVHEIIENHPTLPRGSVVRALREDRDSH